MKESKLKEEIDVKETQKDVMKILWRGKLSPSSNSKAPFPQRPRRTFVEQKQVNSRIRQILDAVSYDTLVVLKGAVDYESCYRTDDAGATEKANDRNDMQSLASSQLTRQASSFVDTKKDLGFHINRKKSGDIVNNSEYDDFESFKLADFREKPQNQVEESELKAKIVTDFVIYAEEDQFISQGKFQPNRWVEDER